MKKQNRTRYKWLACRLGATFFVSVAGCQTVPLDIAAPKPIAAIDGVKSSAERGREVYVSFLKCGMCHRPKPVYDYDPETWKQDILPRMAKKARLKPDDYTAVQAYVTSSEAQTRPSGK